MSENKEVYEFEDFRLDVYKQRLFREKEIISLPPKAIELLVLLVENQGTVVEKEDIIKTLWSDTIVEDANLTQTIYILRKALGKTSDGESLIKTLSKRGYKFVPEVEKNPAEEVSVSVTRTTKENILISREESETVEARMASAPDRESEAIRVYDQIPEKTGPKSFSKKHLLIVFGIVFAGFLSLAFFFNGKNTGKLKKVESVAVIPFQVMGARDKEGYLSVGLADTLITRLGQTKKINVISTEKIQRFTNSELKPTEIGRRLGADAVLTGNLQKIENRVRFNAQLLRVDDGKVIWSNQFDERADDLFGLQDSLTRRIIKALTLELSEAEQKQVSNNPTNDPEALKLYWQGRFYWNKRTPELIQKGIVSFEKAIEIDPNFAKAYAGLADSYALAASGLSSAERLPKAIDNAKKALELDEGLAETHASLAIVTYKFRWDADESIKHFKRAIELNDSYPTAHHWYGEFLVLLGRHEEGLNELRKAEQLDPFSLSIKTDIGEGLYRAKRFDKAITQLKKVLEFDQNRVQPYRIIRHLYFANGKKEVEVVKYDLEVNKHLKVSDEKIEELRKIYDTKGWEAYWNRRLETLSSSPTSRYFIEKIVILIFLGRNIEAAKQIENKIRQKSLSPFLLRGDPIFEQLHLGFDFSGKGQLKKKKPW